MIRVNLLGTPRTVRKKTVITESQKILGACATIMLLGVAVIGWRFLSVRSASAALDAELATAQKESTRLHPIIAQVQQLEQRKAQLQQRVVLIEELRKAQTGPVHMLDEISRALPALMWLTEMKQSGADVTVEGQCPTLTALSDFVANLEASGYFKRSVEIVNSSAEAGKEGEFIKFQVKATFQAPTAGKSTES